MMKDQKFYKDFAGEQNRDLLDAFDCKVTLPEIEKTLRKIIVTQNRNNVKDILLRYLYRWRMNCVQPEENKVEKLRLIFEEYLNQEPIRKKDFQTLKKLSKL